MAVVIDEVESTVEAGSDARASAASERGQDSQTTAPQRDKSRRIAHALRLRRGD